MVFGERHQTIHLVRKAQPGVGTDQHAEDPVHLRRLERAEHPDEFIEIVLLSRE